MDRCTIEQAIDICLFAGVSAVEPMFTQDQEITALRYRRIGRLGNIVRIGQAGGDLSAAEFQQLVGREAEKIEVERSLLELSQLLHQPIVIPVGQLG
jgi:hypothetical protein